MNTKYTTLAVFLGILRKWEVKPSFLGKRGVPDMGGRTLDSWEHHHEKGTSGWMIARWQEAGASSS